MSRIYLILSFHSVVGINAYDSREIAEKAAKEHFKLDKFEILELYPVGETTVNAWLERKD